MKYAVITFGCRVNQADSLGFEEQLIARGGVATSPDTADLVVVNTCSVTATSDQGARQTIRRVARDNPNAQIVVTGCYATREPDEVASLPNVVRVVPNDEKPNLIRLVTKATAESAEYADRQGLSAASTNSADAFDGPCGAAIAPGVMGRTAFTLRVQTGCAEPCSYCIIPSTRGRPRSTPISDLLREIERVAALGFKEIALTGVHLGSYGRDLTPPASLADLLSAIGQWVRLKADTTAVVRSVRLQPDYVFRISSLEPMDCTPEIVRLVASSDCFAPHFHLPLQHASNRVLAAMRRPYTIEQYAALVDELRARIPKASIGSDVIVGFPGETDADFDELAGYLAGSPLTHVHVFPYSDRPGTPASRLQPKVHGAVVRERARRIRDIARDLTRRFRDDQVGTVHRALTLEDGSLVVTGNYLKVRIPPGRARNDWVRVRITSHDDGELLGG
jgi:threonylcarbamoyladenosine tRNA methylthiotransferase MtaB